MKEVMKAHIAKLYLQAEPEANMQVPAGDSIHRESIYCSQHALPLESYIAQDDSFVCANCIIAVDKQKVPIEDYIKERDVKDTVEKLKTAFTSLSDAAKEAHDAFAEVCKTEQSEASWDIINEKEVFSAISKRINELHPSIKQHIDDFRISQSQCLLQLHEIQHLEKELQETQGINQAVLLHRAEQVNKTIFKVTKLRAKKTATWYYLNEFLSKASYVTCAATCVPNTIECGATVVRSSGAPTYNTMFIASDNEPMASDTRVLTYTDVSLPEITLAGASSYTSFAITKNGVFGRGMNKYGDIGLDDKEERKEWTKIPYFDDKTIVQLSCGLNHCFFLEDNGTLHGSGGNYCGQFVRTTTLITTVCRV